MEETKDILDEHGERRDAELFEDNLGDGTWIPLGFAWNSPSELAERARDMEEFAAEELKRE